MSTNPDALFMAFADRTRLRILHLLADGELCVCDMTAVLRQGQSKVSRHLAYLRRAGLVVDRRQGRWKHYSLARPKGRLHSALVSCVGGCLGEFPALRKDRSALAALKRDAARCRPRSIAKEKR